MDIRFLINLVVLHKIRVALEHTVSNIYKKVLFQAIFLLAFHGFIRIRVITSIFTANHVLHVQMSQVTFQKGKV